MKQAVDDLAALLAQRPQSLEDLIASITPVIYQNLKSAVELGKWEDGARLSQDQLEYCMQALILYQAKHLPQQERAGSPLTKSCKSAGEEDNTLQIRAKPDLEPR